MVTDDLIAYIKKELSQGANDVYIHEQLVPHGWSNEDIQEGMKVAKKSMQDNNIVHNTVIGRLLATRTSAFFTFVFFNIAVSFLLPLVFLPFRAVFPVGPFFYIFLHILIVFLLRRKKYNKEADNWLKAIGMGVLFIVILLLIGFGVCLIALR